MKYIIVTGAYGGMGRATVELLIKQGYCVFALDKNTEEQNKSIIPVKVDVTNDDSIKAAVQTVKNITDEVSAIIHFAGIYELDSLAEISGDDFKRIFDINLYGAFAVNKYFLPLLKQDSRIIITTSELAPLMPLPFTGLYAISKSALDKYAYSLRMELQLLGIKVSVIRAGAVNTGMLGVSTSALDKFCQNTRLYKCNAERFKKIVDSVESKNIPPEKIAKKAFGILNKRSPGFAYSINRSPLLCLFGILPQKMQFWVIRRVLE